MPAYQNQRSQRSNALYGFAGHFVLRWKMALRWRNYGNGKLLCAAIHSKQAKDTYIDDALHYKLAVELKVIFPDANESTNGVWHWIKQSE